MKTLPTSQSHTTCNFCGAVGFVLSRRDAHLLYIDFEQRLKMLLLLLFYGLPLNAVVCWNPVRK